MIKAIKMRKHRKIRKMNIDKKRKEKRLYDVWIDGVFYKCVTLCDNGFIHNY